LHLAPNLAGAPAPDVTNERPHDSGQYACRENGLSNQQAYRIHQDEVTVGVVETIETADHAGQREQRMERESLGAVAFVPLLGGTA